MSNRKPFLFGEHKDYLGRVTDAMKFTVHPNTGLWTIVGLTQGLFTLLFYGWGLSYLDFWNRDLKRLEIPEMAMFCSCIYSIITPMILPIAVFPVLCNFFHKGREATVLGWINILKANHFKFTLYYLYIQFLTFVGFLLFFIPGALLLIFEGMGWMTILYEKKPVFYSIKGFFGKEKINRKPTEVFNLYISLISLIFFELISGVIGIGILASSSKLFILLQLAYVLFHCVLYSYFWTVHFVMLGFLYYEDNPPGVDEATLTEINEIGRE